MQGPEQSNPCAICHGGMGAGGGQAIFTARCSHNFHFRCISAVVTHGHLVCPLCRERTPVEPNVFDDDEQVEPDSGAPLDGRRPTGATSNGALVVKTHCELAAIARGSSRGNFAVLVHATAPGIVETEAAGAAPRAPLDLVTVLDVSGSMSGNKIALLKQAMGFVIDNLGPDDRLCVVSFSSGARRVTRLARMSADGKAQAKSAVEFLVALGGTNIAEGLRTAAKVLDERRHRNAVSSVILLSDGQDNHTLAGTNYEALVPPSFQRTGPGDWSAPIHTFGFGNDHDAAAMNVIAEATSGTFSYIENEAAIQDAFAQCIGGLLSVVVQDARVDVACVAPGVHIHSVKSGRYQSSVDNDGRAASIGVGELYADEERRFLLFLAVPTTEATDGDTTLIKVTCRYRDAAAGGDVTVAAEDTVVMRPGQVLDVERSAEVERERLRVEASEDIAAARAAAERGAYQEALGILEKRQRVVAQSEAARGGDPMSAALEAELLEMRRLVSDRQSYEGSGRAFMMASCGAHAQQRATSLVLQDDGEAKQNRVSYATPAMRAMVSRSQKASAEQQPLKATVSQRAMCTGAASAIGSSPPNAHLPSPAIATGSAWSCLPAPLVRLLKLTWR